MSASPNQRLRRARAVLALGLVAFVIGALLGAGHRPSAAEKLAERFVAAWTRRDYAEMYTDLDPRSQASISPSSFAAAYEKALRTATVLQVRAAGRARNSSSGVEVATLVRTRLFGSLSLAFVLKVDEREGSGPRVSWSRSLEFPGLRPGELLSRRTSLPRRATLLARDGSVLAESSPGSAVSTQRGQDARSSPLGSLAGAFVGTVGPVPPSRLADLEAQGVPAGALVGVSGLELALDDRLRGSPGGELLAGARLLAYAPPRRASAVRTSVSPALQRAAVTALGGQLGGIVALQPSTGQILAVAGLGLEGLQPPGSTFKIITLSAALQAKIATRETLFPYATYATLDGVKLSNANGEECGGSLELAFAVSCNSVFSPLGVRIGAPRLVAMAERFGFNHAPGIAAAAESSLPAAGEIQGELALGSTAIGQGQVLATPLEMAVAAATIAERGRRPSVSFQYGWRSSSPGRAVSPSVAATVRRLMVDVVRYGTGTAASIPGVSVAGKTGTAELKSASELKGACPSSSKSSQATSGEPPQASSEPCRDSEPEAANTDAWFAAFAPATHPRIAVCVMLVKDGAGGATAAPIARAVLEAALHGGA